MAKAKQYIIVSGTYTRREKNKDGALVNVRYVVGDILDGKLIPDHHPSVFADILKPYEAPKPAEQVEEEDDDTVNLSKMSVPDLDAFAEENEIEDYPSDDNKPDKLAFLEDWQANQATE